MAARSTLVLAAVVMLVAATSVDSAAASATAPPKLYAKSGKARVRASLGSFCDSLDSAESGRCADAVYPLSVKHRLRAHRGARITLFTKPGAKLRNVVVCSVRGVDANGDERRTGCTRRKHVTRRLHVRLPMHMRRRGRLSVSFEFGTNGDADYEVGLKLKPHKDEERGR